MLADWAASVALLGTMVREALGARAARRRRRKGADAAYLAVNDRIQRKPAKRRSKPGTTAPSPDIESIKPGQRIQTVLLPERRRVRTRMDWGYRKLEVTWLFRDARGRQVLWAGTNPAPVNVRGYRQPGRHPILRGLPLTVAATVKAVKDDGTVVLSRPYLRPDRQPEPTKRAYVEQCGVAPGDVGLREDN